MRSWHSLYEILLFPLLVLFTAFGMIGLGNILTNDAFTFINISSDFAILLGRILMRTGSFIATNFPILLLVRLTARKNGSAASITAALCGYIAFQVTTMYFSSVRGSLPSTAYSSILGLSMTSTDSLTLRTGTHYPLQTGIVSAVIIAVLTQRNFSRSRRRNEYGFFSFIQRDSWMVLVNIFWSVVLGIIVSLVWPYFINLLQQAVDFISADTTNPVNLTSYGVLDRLLSVLGLSSFIRTPFWYNTNGGSWISVAGTNVAGDVNIWTSQVAASNINGMAGRFITPYYVINIFAIPGLILGMYSMQTDRLEKRRTRGFYILLAVCSILGGILLPMDLLLLLLCPMLFFFHVMYSSVLFGVFQAMHVYLGFNYTGTSTITALPGTLLEFLSYMQSSQLLPTIIRIVIVGVISFFVYLFMTRFYFRHLALDLFHTGVRDDVVKGTIKAVGGVENIKLIHSSTERLVISLYDPSRIDVAKLQELGAVRVTETRAGFSIAYGAASTMIHLGIERNMRDSIRSVPE